MKVRITKNCSCEGDLHELMYPREGLTVREFDVGEELEFREQWSNMYGSYYRCEPQNGEYKPIDIALCNGELVD